MGECDQRLVTERFNPRPRAGANTATVLTCTAIAVSIHAPRGGEQTPPICRLHSTPFQSTPPRGGEPEAAGAGGWAGCFNPRPRAGANIWRRSWPMPE